MYAHNAPRMLDEVLSVTGDYTAPYGRMGAIVVYATNRAMYYGLADYVVSSAIGAGALVLVAR